MVVATISSVNIFDTNEEVYRLIFHTVCSWHLKMNIKYKNMSTYTGARIYDFQ